MKAVSIPFLSLVIATVAFLFALPAVSFAQSTSALMNAARRIDDSNKQSDKATRDAMEREMRSKKPNPEEIRRAKALEAQIEKDLSALQSGYNDIVMQLQSRETIDDQYVSETADRIHRHSERLLSNIAFPKHDKEVQPSAERAFANHRKALVELCSRILAFFDDGIFQNPNVIDVEGASLARGKLDAIVRLAHSLRTGVQ